MRGECFSLPCASIRFLTNPKLERRYSVHLTRSVRPDFSQELADFFVQPFWY